MLKLLQNLLPQKKTLTSVTEVNSLDVKQTFNEVKRVPRYPPFDHGVPVVVIDSIIESQADLISRIKVAFGATPEFFDEMVMRTIENYAAYVHLLPATKNENHNNAGGLFRLGLEVGFYSLQSADGKIFSTKESAERRRAQHPKWVFATFIAGLCSEIYRPITSMSVVNDSGEAWPALINPLYTWARDLNSERYHIHWTDVSNNNSQIWHSAAAYVLNMVIPPKCLQYLNEDNAQIVTFMTATIMGAARHGDGNMIGQLVRNSSSQVIDKDLKANSTYYGKLTVGAHLEPHIIDIMRELIATDVWTINTKQSRIWYAKEGCFIVWGPAFNEITSVMAKRKIAGIPSSPDTLAEMLMGSGVIEQQRNGSPYWDITLPGSPKLVETIKIVDPKIILTSDEHQPLSVSITSSAAQEFFGSISNKKNNPNKSLFETDVASLPKGDDQDVDVKQHKEVINKDISNKAPIPATFFGVANEKPTNTSSNEIKKVSSDAVTASKLEQVPLESHDKPSEDVAMVSSNIIDQISINTRNLLNAIKSDFIDSNNEHPVWWTDKGLIISRSEFESHGIPHVKALDELVNINWIVRDPNNNRIIIKSEVNGQQVSGYLLNKSIALTIGFKE